MHQKDERTISPLTMAVANNNVFAITALLKAGVDISEVDSFNCNVIFLSVDRGNIAVLKLLLNHIKNFSKDRQKAILHQKVERGHTPFSFAIVKNNVDAIAALLNHIETFLKEDKDFFFKYENEPYSNGKLNPRTLLNFAIKYGNVEIVRLLLNAGIDIRKEFEPIFLAVEQRNIAVLKLLLDDIKRFSEEDQNALIDCNFSGTPLACAIYNDSVDAIIALLNAGADIRKVDDAILSSRFEPLEDGIVILNLLLEHIETLSKEDKDRLLNYTDEDYIDADGQTALSKAIQNDNVDAVNALLDAGADLFQLDDFIYDAVGKNTVLPLLLNYIQDRADKVKFLDYERYGNPLLLASEYNDPYSITLLLDADAKINVKDGDGLNYLTVLCTLNDDVFDSLKKIQELQEAKLSKDKVYFTETMVIDALKGVLDKDQRSFKYSIANALIVLWNTANFSDFFDCKEVSSDACLVYHECFLRDLCLYNKYLFPAITYLDMLTMRAVFVGFEAVEKELGISLPFQAIEILLEKIKENNEEWRKSTSLPTQNNQFLRQISFLSYTYNSKSDRTKSLNSDDPEQHLIKIKKDLQDIGRDDGSKIKVLARENARNKLEIEELKLEIKELKLEEAKRDARMEQLNNENAKLEARVEQLENENAKLEIEELKLEIEELKLEIEELKLEKAGLKLEKAGLKVRLDQLEKKF